MDILQIESFKDYESLRLLMKNGSEFSKEIIMVLQERSELACEYSKNLQRLSEKLLKLSIQVNGSISAAWHRFALDIQSEAYVFQDFSTMMVQEVVKPLKSQVDSDLKSRKQLEVEVEKAQKEFTDKQQLDQKNRARVWSTTKEYFKAIDGKEAKKNDPSTKKLDEVEKVCKKYRDSCINVEKAKFNYCSVLRENALSLQALEEGRIRQMQGMCSKYVELAATLGPGLCKIGDDLKTVDLQFEIPKEPPAAQEKCIYLLDVPEEMVRSQLNPERRREMLEKWSKWLQDDLLREKRSREGLENLFNAYCSQASFADPKSRQNVGKKFISFLDTEILLEVSLNRVQMALATAGGPPIEPHKLAPHIATKQDKQGVPYSVLKIPYTDGEVTQGGEPPGESSPTMPVYVGECRAKFDYTAQQADELSFNTGDIIRVLRKHDPGWWEGECEGRRGVFPVPYVDVL